MQGLRTAPQKACRLVARFQRNNITLRVRPRRRQTARNNALARRFRWQNKKQKNLKRLYAGKGS